MMRIEECAREEQTVEFEEKENRDDVNSDFQKKKDTKPTLEAATFEVLLFFLTLIRFEHNLSLFCCV